MSLKFKKEYQDILVKSPITGEVINTLFVDESEYIHWCNRSHAYMFEEVKIKSKKEEE